ncbi:MAG: hypothetical protein Athens071412_510, partial [Parcubacteria group bacterium Athens0714_12]
MNKLIIPIIAVLILAAGIGISFIFQKPAFPEPQRGKCGDGICDDFEKKNPDLCPQDCKEKITASPTLSVKFQDSPFSFHAKCESVSIKSCESLRDISEVGAKWVRFSGVGNGLVWDAVEQEKDKYDWSNTDYAFLEANQSCLSLMVTVIPINRFYNDLKNPRFIPTDWNAY